MWIPLKEGDVVDIVAPGSGKTDVQLETSMNYLTSLGLVPRVSSKIFEPDLLFSNSKSKRFENLRQALYAEDSKAVWCIRGGTGSAWLVPELATLAPPKNQKLFIGFSDITCLHIFLHQKWSWRTVHGPTLTQLIENKLYSNSINSIQDLIFGHDRSITFENLVPLNVAARDNVCIESSIVGGNLSLIQYSIGTDWQLKTAGRVLFCEDVNEKAFRTAEKLEHLRQAGLFQNCAAILFGEFCFDQNDPDEDKLYSQILQRFADEISSPVFSGLGVGHGNVNWPILIGANCDLNLGKNANLVIREE